ncbi:hypothetical protein X747_08825 [Mesorhizobium sp. LNJC384A00]|nr:hypothetical protein X766_10100 [Mesorhizobium sp. LSJC255A00]ESX32921.1 hypothetical protein X765_06280 [Mesorhizobium sp. LSHC440B00]ESX44898.1 hypothetical protein X764_01145 [Mesorhizobium sp. LSHC440A00]ESX80021.1 hypothetical protein X757_03665 [Mesorhizobium sp. LSHC414A00]ESY44096.1 hypothetical protein X747_08825 [Mesorhizobium sp. LNJC384A00]
MTAECLFADAHERLKCTNEEREQRLEERLTLAKEMTGSVDPLDFIVRQAVSLVFSRMVWRTKGPRRQLVSCELYLTMVI